MSSALRAALTSLQQNDYATVAILTAVAYDYFLTFSNEVEYIWTKRWTWVSTLFRLIRYVGFYTLAIPCFLGSSFLPGPEKLCEILFTINLWSFLLFLGAADIVMILRVWAIYNRSKLVIRMLIVVFTLEIIFTVLAAVIYTIPKNQSAPVFHLRNVTLCLAETSTPLWTQVAGFFQIAHAAVICVLAIIQFARQSFQMYGITKRWQLNQYMNLLVSQGILYFIAIFLISLINVLAVSGNLPIGGGWQLILTAILQYVPLFTLSPRFVISIRVLYARDVQGRQGEGIDTGFGLPSLPMSFAGGYDSESGGGGGGDSTTDGDSAGGLALGVVEVEVVSTRRVGQDVEGFGGADLEGIHLVDVETT